MRATMLIGEPCTGKSTIMKAVLEQGCFAYRNDSRLPRHEDPLDKIVVVGRYDEEHQFPGTDRLSMSIKPIVMEHAQRYGHLGWHVVWEGARLGHGRTIEDMQALGFDVRVGWVVTDPEELQVRRALERTQPEHMLKRAMTTCRNIAANYPAIVTPLRCDAPEDVPRAMEWVVRG